MIVLERTYFVNLIATVVSIVAAVVVYFFVLIRMGGLKRQDIVQVPKGTAILRLLERIHWM